MAVPLSYFDSLPRRSIASFKMHARRAGMTLEGYLGRRAAGEKRCPVCSTWKSEADFQGNARNWDGLHASCRDCNSRIMRREREQRRFPTQAIAARRAAIDEQKARRDRDAALVARANARKRRKHDTDPDVRAYRAERRSFVNRLTPILADAKREFDAMLAREEIGRRGGRPPKKSRTA